MTVPGPVGQVPAVRDPAALTEAAIPGVGALALAFAALDEDAALFAAERALREQECRSQARRREFTAGRLAAHLVLTALGRAPEPVLMAGRRPQFPPGVAGSLRHSGLWAVAGAGRFAMVGVDLETAAARCALGPRAVRLFCAPEEQQADVLAVFSAKESVYKALGGRATDGAELPLSRIVCEPAAHGFTAYVTGQLPFPVRALHGADGSVLTATARPHPHPAAPCPPRPAESRCPRRPPTRTTRTPLNAAFEGPAQGVAPCG
ncbi:4'-phosphopantetheinyl transferase superfamily protein [Streptomyces hundungensis]|uniref:4'-phosphopantetheinyl transferase superfamily protein n=1 Tax=Streptomyces hundungensis TaxID=1077946 RepID=UPI0033FD51D1